MSSVLPVFKVHATSIMFSGWAQHVQGSRDFRFLNDCFCNSFSCARPLHNSMRSKSHGNPSPREAGVIQLTQQRFSIPRKRHDSCPNSFDFFVENLR
mmetsp:Transcript_14673/g.35810  ORF Transcript_14673/g.35810 Transcript_14673/m.35810 type:complete len:97 (+) Transcript_14673:233-523(+)